MIENETQVEEAAQENSKIEASNDEPKTYQQAQEIHEQENSSAQEDSARPTESSQAKNFRALREAKESAERERDAMLQKIKDLESKSLDDDNFNIADDDLVEGKHLSKVSKKIRKLEEQVQSYKAKSSEIAVEAKLKAQHPDFDKIVSKDNVDALRASYPELAETISSSGDLYSKAIAAYTMIKRLGINQEDSYQSDKETAHKNSSKPRPLTSMSPQQGDGPLSRANAFADGLTDDLKEQLYKEMLDSMK